MLSAARHWCLAFGLAVIFVLAPARGETPFVTLSESQLTLDEVFRLALHQNPQLLESLAEYRLARLQVGEAYTALYPTLDLTADFLRQSQDQFGIDTEELQLVFLQPLFDFGKTRWAATAAKLNVLQAGQNLRTQIETLFQTVATDFVQVKLAEKNLTVAQQRLADRQQYLELSQNLFRAGEVAEYEVVQAQATVLSAQEEILSAEMDLAQARAELLVNLGVRPDTRVALEDLPAPAPPPDSVDEGLARSLERRPEVAALRWGLASAEANVKAQAKQNYPTLAVNGELDDERIVGTNMLTGSWQVGLQLSWPMLDGGVAANQAAQARETAEQVRQQLEQTRRQVSLDVVNAYVQLVSLWKQIEVSRNSVEKAEETRKIAQTRFRAGLSDGVELLNAQDNLAEARTTLAQVLTNYRLAQINWYRAISADYPVKLPEDLAPPLEEKSP